MKAKFKIGDHARVAPRPCWSRSGGPWKPWLRPGRVIVIAATWSPDGQHLWYSSSNRGIDTGHKWYRSDELRAVDAGNLRGGARSGSGRPTYANKESKSH